MERLALSTPNDDHKNTDTLSVLEYSETKNPLIRLICETLSIIDHITL